MSETEKQKENWIWHRFKANPEDYRPVTFPPPGPYWCSGEGGGEGADDPDYSIVVAYLPKGTPVTDFWPEATEIDSEPRGEITFTDRFPEPDWWKNREEYKPITVEAQIHGRLIKFKMIRVGGNAQKIYIGHNHYGDDGTDYVQLMMDRFNAMPEIIDLLNGIDKQIGHIDGSLCDTIGKLVDKALVKAKGEK